MPMPTGRLSPLDITNEPVGSDSKCLWSSLLKEVAHKAAFKLPSTRALLVLGDEGCGKTTLITKLQGAEDPKENFGLEYTFIDVTDEDRDDQTKLNVWLLNGDIHPRLLKFALNEENFGECVVMLVVSMSEPWNIMKNLQKWSTILEKHIKSLNIPMETLSEYRGGLVHQFKEYAEPDALLPPSTPALVAHGPLATAPLNQRRPQGIHPATATLLSSTFTTQHAQSDVVNPESPTGDSSSTNVQLSLDGCTLSENLGIPLVVVVTKTDVMNSLEKEDQLTDEHFDYIQMHIRRFCLNYGAALFYVSVKENKHCDLLNRYLQSRMYGFPFTQAAYVVERDCVFVPTGWDSEKKIAILEENFSHVRVADKYDQVVPPPPPRKPTARESETVAEDEQSFLTKLMAEVQRDFSAGGGGGPNSVSDPHFPQSGHSGSSPGQRPNTASPRTGTPNMRSKPTPPGSGMNSGGAGSAAGPNARPSEGVLANFFINLLNKKSSVGGPDASPTSTLAPSDGSSPDKQAISQKDIQNELERLARPTEESVETEPPKNAPVDAAEASSSVADQSQPSADSHT